MSVSFESKYKELLPTTVYVSKEARDDELTRRVLSRLPLATVIDVQDGKDPITEASVGAKAPDAASFTQGKRHLLLTRYYGNWLKHCPGTSGHVCCNLWIVNPGQGCPMDCTYCYLQSYLRRNPTLKLYTNLDGMLDTIGKHAASNPDRVFRVCTGELIDSLVWDRLTDSTLNLVPFFARQPNLVLELKTKSICIENLLELKAEHFGKTVVSWSVNASSIAESDEAYTASIDERILAAAKVVDAGYRVGFHFDPIVYYDGWQDGYLDTIRRIFGAIKPADIAWISLSSLRYRKDLQEMMLKRFPQSRLPFGEQFLASDNKLRYIQPLRLRMIRFMWDELKAVSSNMPVYMCMESKVAWREITGGPPAAGSELTEVFSRHGRKRLAVL